MIIVDAHQDIAWNTLTLDRDYRVSALKHRRLEAGLGRPTATVGLPDSLLGRVALVFATLFVPPASNPWAKLETAGDNMAYRTPREAYELALRQMDYYQRLADEDDRIRLIRSAVDLDEVLKTWEEGSEIGTHKQGLVVLMEGADPILEPKQFEEWYERGVRIVGTAWGATRYSGGTGQPGGLTLLGKELLGQMTDFNAILDLSHMAEEAVYEALERYEGVVIASHSNPRRFCNTDRHFSDDMIRRLAERDGVMGVVMLNFFLSSSWAKGDNRPSLAVIADIIDHVCQITGSAAHVGLGSDFDGGFGIEFIPEELDTSGDLIKISTVLRERGYAEADIDAIMGGNMLRKLRESLPAS